VTTLSATTWAYDPFVASGQPSFRALIAFYPYCNWTFPEMEHLSAPLRIHAGALDDWTPSKPCEHMVAALHAAGYDARITVYPGAQHSFDEVGQPHRVLPGVVNGVACIPRLTTIWGRLRMSSRSAAAFVREPLSGGVLRPPHGPGPRFWASWRASSASTPMEGHDAGWGPAGALTTDKRAEVAQPPAGSGDVADGTGHPKRATASFAKENA
jgi:hypothetical protein